MIGFLLMPAIIYIPAGIYLYHFFRRFFTLFSIKGHQTAVRVCAIVLSVACAVAGWQVFGLGSVIVLHFLLCMLLTEVVYRLVRRARHGVTGKLMDFLYKSGLPAALVIVVVFSYGYVNMHQVKETSYVIETNKKLDESLRIAQITDLHMGITMNVEKLQEYLSKIEAKEPDLLVLTGDIFDERTDRKMMEQAAAVLGGVSTRYGVYYIWGNHDPNRYSNGENYSKEELRAALQSSGIVVLEDEGLQVNEQLAIVGRLDPVMDAERKGVTQLLEGLNPESFILLLDHRPAELEENAAAGVDLQLSGHTHAGQIWPTGQLSELVGITEKNYGHEKIGNYNIIVSSGIAGWGYAIRTGGSSEYVLIDVKKNTD